MVYTILSEKGQVVIPKTIRDLLNIMPADRLEVSLTEENTIVMKPIPSIDEVYGMIKVKTPITKKDIKEAKELHILKKFNL